eukprot:TRINITY_DN6328_c0_g1_i1.p1 TRINITY_DN6328_c0_g1~~TRINITY_DN6328_c0_g1_i1.p1  ORF type:complete len:220 (-),score=40.10 TRINITY_DN6328_c0_g1_i1:187-813(-)
MSLSQSHIDEYDHLVKIILVGDSGVGKSCLLNRFTDNEFSDAMMSTIGVDFKFRTVDIAGKKLKLQLWDTAGQERFRTITANYYRGSHGIILVYDVTNIDSFNNISQWIHEIKSQTKGKGIMMLVGNKSDLESKRAVDFSTAQEYALRYGLTYLESSALENKKIDDLFYTLSKSILASDLLQVPKPATPTFPTETSSSTPSSSGYCCW